MKDIQTILGNLATDPVRAVRRLREVEDGAQVIAALRASATDDARQLLCDVLGFRGEGGAVDALVDCLGDPSAEVRSSAADALAKIADRRAGPALLARVLAPEPDPGVYRMLVVALGAVGHDDAIAVLLPMLDSPDPSLRGSAAWSLGVLGGQEALPVLTAALDGESSPYAADRMREAAALLTRGARKT